MKHLSEKEIATLTEEIKNSGGKVNLENAARLAVRIMRRHETGARKARGLISRQLRLMELGDSITLTRQLRRLPVKTEGNKLSQMVSSYLTRRRPGCTFTQESFTAITHRGNLYAGVIVTLVAVQLP